MLSVEKYALDGRLSIDAAYVFFRQTLGSLYLPVFEPILRFTTVIGAQIMSTLPPPCYAGWVDVGWQRHCETCRSLRERDNRGTVFFSAVDDSWRSSYRRSLCAEWRTFTQHKGHDRIT